MKRSADQIREDALAIWRAGVAAVDSERLVREACAIEDEVLRVGDAEVDLRKVRRIAVLGGGKAGAGMAAAVETVLGSERIQRHRVGGWVNVPADCVRELTAIRLHAARPAGLNEPTEEGVAGTREILKLAEGLGEEDLCLVLLSGGGSALLPAPVAEITLADKVAVTQHLSASGADIVELNTVRKALSEIKGGGLAQRCGAGTLATMIISDVMGDPLSSIASGPTVDEVTSPEAAMAVLERYGVDAIPRAVMDFLRGRVGEDVREVKPQTARIENVVIGNNAMAVDAAGMEAERRGYSHAMRSNAKEGFAEDEGRKLAEMAAAMRDQPGPDCLITGGEPVVRLCAKEARGLGGRNQQLALAALGQLAAVGPEGIALVAGGTDGEDGPTDAAGAVVDARMIDRAARRGLKPADYLRRNDAYRFFEAVDGLVKTGPTHTNVCDVRVVTVSRVEVASRA